MYCPADRYPPFFSVAPTAFIASTEGGKRDKPQGDTAAAMTRSMESRVALECEDSMSFSSTRRASTRELGLGQAGSAPLPRSGSLGGAPLRIGGSAGRRSERDLERPRCSDPPELRHP